MQLSQIWETLSLPEHLINAIKRKSEELLEQQLKENNLLLKHKKRDYLKAQEELESVEKKWINNQMAFDTYQRWYARLTDQRSALNAQIQKLSQDQNETWLLLQEELSKLSDLDYIYNSAETVQKQNMIRLGFDDRLYYQEKIYRTPYMMKIFEDKALILKENGLMIYTPNSRKTTVSPSGGAGGTRTRVQTSLP